MNVSIVKRSRVHALRDGFPACGGGSGGKKRTWQADFGEVTCKRCLKITAPKSEAAATSPAKP